MYQTNNINRRSNKDMIYIPSKNGYISIPVNNLRSELNIEKSNSVKSAHWITSRIINNFQYISMLVGMIFIPAYISYLIGGLFGLIIATAIGSIGFYITSDYSIEQFLKRKRVKPIHPMESRLLYSMIEKLAQKAGLQQTPYLFLDYGQEMNAYTIADKEKAAIVISNGLLENLDRREIYGVLAHEIAHLKNNDIRRMLAVEQIRRMTGYMAMLGQILLILNLPLMLFNQVIIPWSLVLFLMGAPFVSMLIQVALSRNREFQADLEAADLSGDPLGLASALQKIYRQNNQLIRFYAPYLREIPELLRTHPATKQRIQKLKEFHSDKKNQLSWASI